MKKGVSVILLLFVVFLIACEEKTNEPIVPFDPIEIKITNLNAGEAYRNEVEVIVELSKTENISKVELYSRRSMISAALNSPYEFKWNTLKEADGENELKVVVYDKHNNKQETSMKVLVENSLLNLSVLGYYSTNNSFVILSDDEGEVLYSGEITPNIQKKIMPEKPYEKDNIHVTVVDLYHGYSQTHSYLDIRRGAQWQLGFVPKPLPKVREVAIHLKNAPEFTAIRLHSQGGEPKLIQDLETDTLSGMTLPYIGEAKVYVEMEKADGTYFKLVEIKGDDLDIDLQGVNTPFSNWNMALAQEGWVRLYVSGRYTHNNEMNAYPIALEDFYFEEDRLSLEYPGEPFHSYYVDITFSKEKDAYNNLIKGELPSTFKFVEADINVSNAGLDNFKAAFNGDFDYYKAHFNYDSPAPYYNMWWVWAPAYKTDFKLPEISRLINHGGLELKNLSLNRVELFDLSGYADQPGDFGLYQSYPSPYSDAALFSRIIQFPR